MIFEMDSREAVRLYAKIEVSTEHDCWLWTGSLDKYGYGKFRAGGKCLSTSRFSYLLHKGEIPQGLVVDHICRNRRCVNPEHLRLLTNAENVLCGEGRTAKQARQTHCKRGHPLFGENLWFNPKAKERQCRTCHRDRNRINMRRYYQQKKANGNPSK